jgi:hypothetical protein
MIAVKVTYTVKPGFVQKNQENIRMFMADFKEMDPAEFRYQVYLLEDGVSFLHLSHFKNEEVQKQVLSVPSFKLFQRLRDESGLNDSHRIETMNVVEFSSTIFNESEESPKGRLN